MLRITPKPARGSLQSQTHRIKLPAGSAEVVVRPIRPSDGPRLAEGLRHLSPESRRGRFLFSRGRFSAEELDYFTRCNGVDHLALVVVATEPNGRERQFVAVARSIQDLEKPNQAEVAIAVADDWQHHGVGEMLIQALASIAWEAGIRFWNATLFNNNVGMRKLLERVGKKTSQLTVDASVVELLYRLSPSVHRPEHSQRSHADVRSGKDLEVRATERGRGKARARFR